MLLSEELPEVVARGPLVLVADAPVVEASATPPVVPPLPDALAVVWLVAPAVFDPSSPPSQHSNKEGTRRATRRMWGVYQSPNPPPWMLLAVSRPRRPPFQRLPMQTCRHWIFAALSLGAIACAARGPKTTAAICPSPAPRAELHSEPSPPEPEPGPESAANAPVGVPSRAAVEGAPTLRLVRMPAPDTVLLHFNEPVAVSPDLDPRQFRLSLATREREEDGYTGLYYYDPQGEEDPSLATRVAGVVANDEHTLRLLLARPLDRDMCEELNEMVFESAQDPDVETGLFLHYRDDAAGGVADRDGNRLQDIAEGWARREAISMAYAGVDLPPIEAWGPIGCGFTP